MTDATRGTLNKLLENIRNTKDIMELLLGLDLLENMHDSDGYYPCPLCGEKVEHIEFTSGSDNLFYIKCPNCGLKLETISKGEDNYTKEYLKHKWNRRNGRWEYEL